VSVEPGLELPLVELVTVKACEHGLIYIADRPVLIFVWVTWSCIYRYPATMEFRSVGANPLEIDEINNLIHAVDERLESMRISREALDEVKDSDACRDIEAQIRDLKDQHWLLSKRWRELTQGFLDKE
jgi:hypothetical protein